LITRSNTTGITATAATTNTSTGSGTAANVVQPGIVALPCVKLG
jgi:hypothetical protein